MRSIVIGIVIGGVIGVMIGTTVIAPRLDRAAHEEAQAPTETPPPKPEPTLERAPAEREKTVVRWRMASAYAAALPQLGSLAMRVGRNIWEVSSGGMEIAFFEPGTLVPPGDMFDAVASGTIDAAFSSPSMWSDKEPSLQLFSAIPFGPGPGEYLAWMYFGGGLELLNEIYRPYGVRSIICGMTAAESSGWYRRPFTTPEDLKGLRMRATGLGARVLEKLAVRTAPLKDADIFMAFENGDIDAAEFSTPAIDVKLGFYELAGYNYFPGWHQPSGFVELVVSNKNWESLQKTQQARIEAVCGDNVRYGLAEGEALQYDALKEITAKGVKIKRWPTPILAALKDAWKTVAEEQSATDDNFRRVWKSLSDFRENYAIWNELSRL